MVRGSRGTTLKTGAMMGSVAALALLLWLVVPVVADDATASAEGVQRLVMGSGYEYERLEDSLWSLRLSGRIHEEVRLTVVAHEDLLILFTVLARAGGWEPTPERLLRLLQLNAAYDRVKLGMDGDGGLFLRTDLTARLVDDAEFRINAEQLAAAADEIYAELSEYQEAP